MINDQPFRKPTHWSVTPKAAGKSHAQTDPPRGEVLSTLLGDHSGRVHYHPQAVEVEIFAVTLSRSITGVIIVIMVHSKLIFFPNQAALEGFLQIGLRNRIASVGGTGSPGFRGNRFPRLHRSNPPTV